MKALLAVVWFWTAIPVTFWLCWSVGNSDMSVPAQVGTLSSLLVASMTYISLAIGRRWS